MSSISGAHLKGERETQPPEVFLWFDLHMVSVAHVPAPYAKSKNFQKYLEKKYNQYAGQELLCTTEIWRLC